MRYKRLHLSLTMAVVGCGLSLCNVVTADSPTVNWVASWDEARQLAKSSGKLLMVVVYDSQCPTCIECKKRMFSDASIIKLTHRFICYAADINSKVGKELWQKHLAKRTDVLPATLFMSPTGELIDFVTGYLIAGVFEPLLKRILSGVTIKDLMARVERHPNDIDAVYALAIAYLERDQMGLARPLLERIKRIDPKDKHGYGISIELHLGIYYAYNGKMRDALKHLTRAVKQKRDINIAEEARFQMAIVYYAMARYEDAYRICDELSKQARRQDIRQMAARLLPVIRAAREEQRKEKQRQPQKQRKATREA